MAQLEGQSGGFVFLHQLKCRQHCFEYWVPNRQAGADRDAVQRSSPLGDHNTGRPRCKATLAQEQAFLMAISVSHGEARYLPCKRQGIAYGCLAA